MTAPTGPFFRRGVTKFVACPVVVGAGPTRAELTAGDVLEGITGISGFQITNSPIDTPDLDSVFTSNIGGEDKAGTSSLNFKDKRSLSTATRGILAKGTQLVLVYMPYGDIPGERCEVWPVSSTGVNDQIDMTSFAQYQVGFATPEPPEQNATIPTAP